MEVTGTITKILDKQTGQKKDGSGEWVKQSFVVETTEQYNNLYCFEVFGAEKVDNFNKYNKLNSQVTVEFNVSTNEWQGKYFTSLQAWKISSVANNATVEQAAEMIDKHIEPEDDLPF